MRTLIKNHASRTTCSKSRSHTHLNCILLLILTNHKCFLEDGITLPCSASWSRHSLTITRRRISKQTYGVPYVSKLKNKRVFIYPARNIQIHCRIYKSSQVYIYPAHPARNLYIQSGIYISSTGFIYPARDLYI